MKIVAFSFYLCFSVPTFFGIGVGVVHPCTVKVLLKLYVQYQSYRRLFPTLFTPFKMARTCHGLGLGSNDNAFRTDVSWFQSLTVLSREENELQAERRLSCYCCNIESRQICVLYNEKCIWLIKCNNASCCSLSMKKMNEYSSF